MTWNFTAGIIGFVLGTPFYALGWAAGIIVNATQAAFKSARKDGPFRKY